MLTPKQTCKAVEHAIRKTKVSREARMKYLQYYAGRLYAQNAAEGGKATPINYIMQAITTYVPNLVYGNPKVKIRSRRMDLNRYAEKLELAVNHTMRDIDLRMSLRKAIVDSLVFAGFMKVGIASEGNTIVVDDETIEIGHPFADRVSPDDIILDPMARDWNEQYFVGNKYIARADLLVQAGVMDEETAQRLRFQYDSEYDKEAFSISGRKTVQEYANDDTLSGYISLADVYFPRERVIVTIPHGKQSSEYKEYLRTVPWSGPETGPYKMLGYHFLPDNILPVPPASMWLDLHEMANRVARKMYRQADRLKRIVAYEGSAVEDAQRIVDSEDGEMAQVDNVEAIKPIDFGGVSDDAYKFSDWLKKNFSEMSGNIDLLSGVNSSSGTATEADLLQKNSSVRIADAQSEVYNFTASIAKDIASYIHTDPMLLMEMTQRIDGTDYPVTLTPDDRVGEVSDMLFEIEPYSMARQDPNQRVRRIMEFVATGIPAMAQSFQLLGPAFDIRKTMKVLAREMDLPEAEEFVNGQLLEQMIQAQQMAAAMQSQMQVAQVQAVASGAVPAAGGGRPGQPNPRQMGPSGGTSTQQERRSNQQQSAGQAQAARLPQHGPVNERNRMANAGVS